MPFIYLFIIIFCKKVKNENVLKMKAKTQTRDRMIILLTHALLSNTPFHLFEIE